MPAEHPKISTETTDQFGVRDIDVAVVIHIPAHRGAATGTVTAGIKSRRAGNGFIARLALALMNMQAHGIRYAIGIELFGKHLEVFIEGRIQAKPVELNDLLGERERHHFIQFVAKAVIIDVVGQVSIKFAVTVYIEQCGF